jgi:hypothetical protein
MSDSGTTTQQTAGTEGTQTGQTTQTETSSGTTSGGTATGAPENILGGQQTTVEPFDPEKLTLPEGFEKTEHFEKFSTIAKELGIPHAKAQDLIGLHAEVTKAAQEKLYADWHEQQGKWQKDVQADPEIGGQHLDTVKQTVSKLLDNPELSDPKFREALIFTGAGNNPAVIRTLFRWAKALSEGGSVAGGIPARRADGSTDTTRPSIADAMYPGGPHSGGPKLG